MNIEQMAHEYAVKLLDDNVVDANQYAAWCFELAESMQAESDKRKIKGVPDSLKDYQWQPDWSISPKGTSSWHMNKDGSCYWVVGPGAHAFEDQGKFIVEAWCSKIDAPSFDYNGAWQHSLRVSPIA